MPNPVVVTGEMEAKLTWDAQAYPGDTAMVSAWHDLEAFVASHPVLRTSGWYISVELGGNGGD